MTWNAICILRILKCISLAHTSLPNSRYNPIFHEYLISTFNMSSLSPNLLNSCPLPTFQFLSSKINWVIFKYFKKKKITTHIYTLRESCWIYLKNISRIQLFSPPLLILRSLPPSSFFWITTIDFLYPRCSLHSILKKLSRESLQKLSQVRQCLFLKPWNGSYLPQSENQIHYNGLHGLTCPNSSLPN